MLKHFNSSLKLKQKSSLILILSSSFLLTSNLQAIAQGFFGTVPLPSPSSPKDQNSTNTPLIQFSDNTPLEVPVENRLEYDFKTPQTPAVTNVVTTNIYRVEVPSENELLLHSVRMVEPTAFIRRGEGVIQVGLFRDTENAQNMVKKLADQGITARIVQIATNNGVPTFTPVTVNPTSGSSLNIYGQIENEGYFVVIPAEMDVLANLANRVNQLGVPNNALRLRSAPLGPHLAVGPFGRRDEAERWNNYLRSSGLDARVYFGH